MAISEWKKSVEKDYEAWKEKTERSLKSKEDGHVIRYFDTLYKEHNNLRERYDAFVAEYKQCKKGEKGAGGKAVKLLFIRAAIQGRITVKDGQTCVDIDKEWINKETKDQSGLYDNVFRKGKFTMDPSGEEHWINFCAALHRLDEKVFPSWDAINDFCIQCCRYEKGDNFLYARRLRDVCAFYTIQKGKTAEYKKKLLQRAKRAIEEADARYRNGNDGLQVTATLDMLERLEGAELGDEDEFLQNYIVGSFGDFIFDNDFQYLTAIKTIYNACCGGNLGKDNVVERDYGKIVREIYEYFFSEVFDKTLLQAAIEQERSALRAELFNKFLGVADATGTMLVYDSAYDAAVGDESQYRDYFFNKGIRYYAVLAAMIDLKKSEADINDNVLAVIECINDFLNDCFVRAVEENSYDVFDWFIYQVLAYEKTVGRLDKSYGLDTVVDYLQNA